MGIRGRKGNDRLRTIWTPEMDRYFIELMLEQVGKGNRIDDHLFSKRAWKHMTSLFNSKFKFQYEKDILKNRHKTLRNLYKAIKNLLDQRGFSWDETRQMVTADNNVWDEYIKLHPDARSYRIKTIPYYSDLCLIYQNATVEQKGYSLSQDANSLKSEMVGLLNGLESPAAPVDGGEPGDNGAESSSLSGGNTTMVTIQLRSSVERSVEALHDIMIDEDYGFSLPKENVDDKPQATMDATGSTMGNRSRTYWQPPMDRYFIDLMLDQVQKGNQVDGIFRKQAWMEMIAMFNAKFGFKYDMDVLKNRYKTLRRQYNVIRNLLDLNGFCWDDTRQMVTADDFIWQDYIKAHTDARQYMTRPVPYYKDLCVICRDLSVDGRDSISGQESEDQVGDVQDSSHMGSKNVTSQKNKRQSENLSISVQPKRTRLKDEDMASALRETATAVSSLLHKTKDEEDSNCLSIENVVEAVQALPDMDEDLVLDACDFLEDEKKAKTFLALDVKLRKKWLMRKLRPQML
ncbi:hypothetical protein L1049_003980 [Liquidambar formosana]|uniref:L10-interacting MYB domain-containing protein n=1 Tax=Liquidambar formosana TaxID=63359 RepID=A0AAP0RR72_LIQFO